MVQTSLAIVTQEQQKAYAVETFEANSIRFVFLASLKHPENWNIQALTNQKSPKLDNIHPTKKLQCKEIGVSLLLLAVTNSEHFIQTNAITVQHLAYFASIVIESRVLLPTVRGT